MASSYLNVLIAINKSSKRKYILGVFPCGDISGINLSQAILTLIDLRYEHTFDLSRCINNILDNRYAEISGFEIRFETVRNYLTD